MEYLKDEISRRAELLASKGTRTIEAFNSLESKENSNLPYIVMVIDEYSVYMDSWFEDTVNYIGLFGQACGVCMIFTTSRISADIVNGCIKRNFLSRICLATSSAVASRFVIDDPDGRLLQGKGDMLLLEKGAKIPLRIQSALSKEGIIGVI